MVYLTVWLVCSPLIGTQPEERKEPPSVAAARKALDAWEKGENGGDYSAFKQLLADDFGEFTHPQSEPLAGKPARLALDNLMAERAKTPNRLAFTDRRFYAGEDGVAVRFRSQGKVGGGAMAFDSPMVIIFKLRGDKVVGFEEFLGRIDPKWFQTK